MDMGDLNEHEEGGDQQIGPSELNGTGDLVTELRLIEENMEAGN